MSGLSEYQCVLSHLMRDLFQTTISLSGLRRLMLLGLLCMRLIRLIHIVTFTAF